MAAETNNNMNFSGAEKQVASMGDTTQFRSDKDAIIIVNYASDNAQLDELLQEFQLPEVKPYLTKAEITFESLRYLSKEDIKEAIPPTGLRVLFREKLFNWKKIEYGIDDDTAADAIANKVVKLLQKQTNFGTTPSESSSLSTTTAGGCQLSKSLKILLQESLKGKTITNFYKKNGHLMDSFRADLINLILDDIFLNNTKLSSKEMPAIIEEIIENFPNEIKEYYFIPRDRKKNPGGKLWDKYVNQRSRRARSSVVQMSNLDDSNAMSQTIANTEIDEPLLMSVKCSLSNDVSNWDDIKDKWRRTYLLRQKELNSSIPINEFLNNWPLYSDARCHELVNIDFDLLHPNKSNLLMSKWDEFRTKIEKYYSAYVKDKNSKDIFANSKGITDQNSLDYIYTIILNSVILPGARFVDKTSKILKKISIADANENFVIPLTTINDYENVIAEHREKYYNIGLTMQPFIIVVGPNIYNLEEFYVYFNKRLLKFDTFLKCLDICFKIMQTLSLEYPKGCYGPWLFIQEYFYEITLANNRKLASIYSLHNYLNAQQQNTEC